MKISKTLLVIAFITIAQADVYSQNLVLNPSFEDYYHCPISYGVVDSAVGWRITKGSPDYFNSCGGSNSLFNVPDNHFGYQFAATGEAYLGFLNWTGVNPFFEHFGTHLISPLIVGETYYLSFKVNTAGDTINSGVATNKMGMRFTNVTYDFSTNPSPNDNVAHLYQTTTIYDTVNWVTISGTYIADSAYTKLVVGNFFEYDSIDTNIIHHTASASYYFVDDIYVSLVPQTSGLEINSSIHYPIISPNPTNGILAIKSDILIDELFIFDVSGNLVETMKHPPGEIDVSKLKTGLYFIRFAGNNGIFGTVKFVKD